MTIELVTLSEGRIVGDNRRPGKYDQKHHTDFYETHRCL